MKLDNPSPLISIITPTFNRKKFIIEAIESVLSQTYQNWELIIVDDGSVDNTHKEIKKYLCDCRIKYFYQENQGQSIARNKAIAESSGEFISFLDSDNVWLPNKLALQIGIFLDKPFIDIVYGDGLTIDEDGNSLPTFKITKHSGYITNRLIQDNFISMNTTLARKKCFNEMGAFDEADRIAEDYELWLRFSTKYYFHYEPGNVAKYRVMDDQLSSELERRYEGNEKILISFIDRYGETLNCDEIKNALSTFYRSFANYLLRKNKKGKAISVYFKSLRHKVTFKHSVKFLIKWLLQLFYIRKP